MSLVAERKESRLKGKSTAESPVVSPDRVSRAKAASPCVAPAIITGVLLWACHFPLAWGWLSWVALVPFLTLSRAQATPRRIYLCAYLAGLAFFIPALQFMRVAPELMALAWIMLAVYCALYFPAALWLIRLLDRRVRMPLCWSVPLVWVGLEWVRSFLLTGFAWYYLGHAQHQFSSLIQIADLGGVFAISFLVAAVNGWLCDVAMHIPSLRDRFHWQEPTLEHASGSMRSALSIWLQGGIIASLLVAAVLYGTWRLEQNHFSRGPRVALLQTAVPQTTRNNPTLRDQMEVQNTFLGYFACVGGSLPDLAIWPETSWHLGPYHDISPTLPIEKIDRRVIDMAHFNRVSFRDRFTLLFPTKHLIGVNTFSFGDDNRETHYSSALLVNDDGTPGQRFDKVHRVPFGEYVPLVSWLPFMKAFAPYESGTEYGISPGTKMTRFPIRDLNFGALICFEDSDAPLARSYAQDGSDGKPVDFLVNMSNDGWFQGTTEHEEHLVVSRFRAIENRRSLVRAANMGITAVIDPNGRVLKPSVVPSELPDPDRFSDNPKLAAAQREWKKLQLGRFYEEWVKAKPDEKVTIWEIRPNQEGNYDELPASEYGNFKNGLGVLFAYVDIDHRISLYSQWGDVLPMGCWGLLFAALAWTGFRTWGRHSCLPAA